LEGAAILRTDHQESGSLDYDNTLDIRLEIGEPASAQAPR